MRKTIAGLSLALALLTASGIARAADKTVPPADNSLDSTTKPARDRTRESVRERLELASQYYLLFATDAKAPLVLGRVDKLLTALTERNAGAADRRKALLAELQELRFILMTAAANVGWDQLIGPALERYCTSCQAGDFEGAERGLHEMETELAASLERGDLLEGLLPTANPKRTLALVDRLVAELRAVAQRIEARF